MIYGPDCAKMKNEPQRNSTSFFCGSFFVQIFNHFFNPALKQFAQLVACVRRNVFSTFNGIIIRKRKPHLSKTDVKEPVSVSPEEETQSASVEKKKAVTLEF